MNGTYALTEIHEAPDFPGIYAWYANPPMAAGYATSSEGLRSVLASFASSLGETALDVSLDGRFGRRWQGAIPPSEGQLTSGLRENGAARIWHSGLASTNQREAFLELVGRSVPEFAAPIYIGVSGSLRTRLHAHKAALFDEDYIEGDPVDIEQAKNFAKRCLASGLPVDRLRVIVAQIALDGLTQEEARLTAEAAERFLNGTYTPLFGRR